MLDRDEVRRAVATVKEAPETEMPWLQHSVLYLRAYYLGALTALLPLADEEDLHGLQMATFRETMFPRRGDDTFVSTEVGRAFEALQRSCEERFHAPPHEGHGKEQRSLEEALAHLTDLLDRLAWRWEQNHQEARHLLSGLPEASCERLPWDHVEELVRFAALIETHHKTSERLKALDRAR